MNPILWQPGEAQIEQSNMWRFLNTVKKEYGVEASTYAELHRWSIERPDEFWPAVWSFCNVQASRRWDRAVDHPDAMPGARWFPGSQLNFAENILACRDERPAIIFLNERGERRQLSFAELRSRVIRMAIALQRIGARKGDRVAGLAPNCPETVIAMLGAASLGAIWSSCSPDFGLDSVVDRFGQIQPKILFTANGYYYAGKRINSLDLIRRAIKKIESVEQVVIIPYIADSQHVDGLMRAHHFDEFIAASDENGFAFAQVPFDHPLYIVFSSGTTGIPKAIVHGVGGTLLQHLKEHVLHVDLNSRDRLFYFTTCGWMMWNWLISGLASGATIVLYDGSPFHPDPEVLWRIAERERITVFGTSAKYISNLEKSAVRPIDKYDLSALRTILSTGSPLTPEGFDYVYRDIKKDVQLASISGGTDIISCFALGNPMLPVRRGELQCRGLGMDVHVYDDCGQPVRNQKGELVCARSFPSMPVCFWNDPHGERYHNAYFAKFDGVWCHGDYAEVTDSDGLIIYGRSDAVLNPCGMRIGTAEIYRQVEKLPEVRESIAVGQDWKGDVRVVLFVRLQVGYKFTEELETRIRRIIRENTTPRHVPAKILPVDDIPRTINGKIVELAVRDIIHNRQVANTDSIANPEALEFFKDRPELVED